MRVPILCTVWASIQLHGCGRLKNHSTAIMKSDTHTHTHTLTICHLFNLSAVTACSNSACFCSAYIGHTLKSWHTGTDINMCTYSMFTSLFQNPQLSLIMTHVCSCDRLTANSSSAAATAPHGDTVSHQGCSQ